MRNHPLALRLVSLVSVLLATPWVGAETGALANQCRFCSTHSEPAPAAVESSKYKKYTPDRLVEIQHLALDITPDFQKRTIKGRVEIRFKAIAKPLSELRLNAVDLSVLKAESSEAGFKHQATTDEIICAFSPSILPGKEASVLFEYSAEPVKGLYFRTREMGYPFNQIWSQGESVESRHWFPCFDHPVAKFTSEVTCHLPEGMVALSNGKQLSATKGPNGLTAFRWLQDKPHANYLIALVAGELSKVEDKLRDIPLEFWTTHGELPQAANSFRTTKHAMEFFERELGVAYPWAKYAQVVVQDFHWGGMENTSLTTLTERTLFSKETENLFDSQSLVAHELAHQWFGDLVTCRDWSHIWLNEGFATYYDWLWQGSYDGQDQTRFALYNAAKGIFNNTNETRGIVWRKFNDPGEMFNYLAYPKGAWVLHMLRSQLGPDLYRQCIQTYLQRFAYQSATSQDLQKVVEEISGRSFERFFDQWLNGVGVPVLDVNYEWSEATKLAKVSVKQTQKITEEAPLFQFPLVLRFSSDQETLWKTVQVKEKQEDFFFPLKTVPKSVRVNADLSLLAKINFKPATAMVFEQLSDNNDIIGQLLALDQLAEKPDSGAVTRIKDVLRKAAHYGVRCRAAEVLQKARSEEALLALLGCIDEPDARVRNAVVAALGGFYKADVRQVLLRVAQKDRNPGVRATALRSLAGYQTPEVRDVLVGALRDHAYRERVAEAALGTMKAQADSFYTAPLLEWLGQNAATLPSTTVGAALEALGAVQSSGSNKDTARETLVSYLTHPREKFRTAAIAGLSNLEDPKAIPVLETFAQAAAYKPEKVPAEKALERIRAAGKAGDAVKDLRSELLILQEAGREMKKELETLRKKVEAKP